MKKCKHHIAVILFCCSLFCCGKISAQQNILLKIIPVDSVTLATSGIQDTETFSSRKDCFAFLAKLPSQLAAKGYAAASIDSVAQDNSHVFAYLFLGKKYRWRKITVRPVDQIFLEQLGFQIDEFDKAILSQGQFNNISDAVLNYYLNHGYPFAKVSIDSILFDNDELSGMLNINKGYPYNIDSINVVGKAAISQSFLHHYLGFAEKEPYNLRKLQTVDGLIQNLPYVRETKSSDVSMMNLGAVLNLYLEKKQTNEIDAIIGFLPSNGNMGGKLLLTGQVNLNLKNAFGNGEIIGVNWQELQPQSPQINLQFSKPYLFKSPFGMDFSFNLYKQDSAYVNVDGNMGTTYQFSQNQSGKLFVNFASSRLLDVDTLQIISTKKLPSIIDESATNIGFGYNFNNTDYHLNPRKGSEFSATVLLGNKTIKKNNTITQIRADGFDYNSLYDTVQLKSYQIKLQASGAHYFSLGKFAVLKTAANLGLYQSPAIYNNDMFLIGGYHLLRGFDEASIYTNAYAVGTLEFRYLIGINSYFFGFSDFGVSRYQNNSANTGDHYLSLGVGMAFETKAGIFNFAIASGKDKENSFGLNKAKVHIGYTALF